MHLKLIALKLNGKIIYLCSVPLKFNLCKTQVNIEQF